MANGQGGRRAGAGRKSGDGWKPTKAIREVARTKIVDVVASGRDPIDFLVGVVNDPNLDIDRRMSAAATVLPYLHPRLSYMAVSGQSAPPAQHAQLLETINARIARLVPPQTATIDAVAEPAQAA